MPIAPMANSVTKPDLSWPEAKKHKADMKVGLVLLSGCTAGRTGSRGIRTGGAGADGQ